jgi:hypothetical protein
MMQSHQRLSQYKILNYENKIIQLTSKVFGAVTQHKYDFLVFCVCVYMYLCMSPLISIIVLNCLPLVGPKLKITILILILFYCIEYPLSIYIYSKCRTMNPSTNTSTHVNTHKKKQKIIFMLSDCTASRAYQIPP